MALDPERAVVVGPHVQIRKVMGMCVSGLVINNICPGVFTVGILTYSNVCIEPYELQLTCTHHGGHGNSLSAPLGPPRVPPEPPRVSTIFA